MVSGYHIGPQWSRPLLYYMNEYRNIWYLAIVGGMANELQLTGSVFVVFSGVLFVYVNPKLMLFFM